MLQWFHLITVFVMLIVIVILAITKLKGWYLVTIALVLCVIYIVVGWKVTNKYSWMAYDESKECIIGKNKDKAGIFNGGCFDVWHIYHILFWIIVGMLVPWKVPLIVAISVLWEVIEHYVFKYKVAPLCNHTVCGRIEDVVLNIVGYIIGSYIA